MRVNRSIATACLVTGLLLMPQLARAETVLHLSVTASVTAMPDELVAQLTAQADAPTAADAQSQVNAMIARALADAKTLDAVTASTTSYSVWHETDPKDVWHASQGMALRAHDGAALLGLIGKLQQDGLALGDLSWQLSPALSDKTSEQATAQAIGKLTAQVDSVAKLLHLTAHGFSSVTVGDNGQAPPRPMMRMMATAAPAAAPPPSAQADVVTVSATVSGDARLEP